MLAKCCEFLSGIPMIIVSGVFLVISFILSHTGTSISVDPAWVTVIVSGFPILYSAIRKLIYNRGISKISSALLISAAMTAAVIIGDLFAAGEVAFIMAIGELLEDLTTERAKKGLKKLIALTPLTARKLVDGKEITLSISEIDVGDIIRILPGETIPVDGTIVSGESSIDQSVITGESIPVDKAEGDEVFCGTLNCFGAIDVKASKVGKDSSLQKLIRLVEEAEKKKAPTARVADKWASILVPIALLIAVITGLITHDITRAVTVLGVFCPCALVLSVPLAFFSGISHCYNGGNRSGNQARRHNKIRRSS